MLIRDEEPQDIPAIREVIEAAFGRPLEADLAERLRRDGDSVISLVAADGDDIAGHVIFSRMNAPTSALGLGPVSVAPARQDSGIGTALILAGLERAAKAGWQSVFVLGEPGYYRRFGFDPALAQGFASPYAGPYFMALALNGALPAREGAAEYAPAFAGLA
jgi:putative acetyltransferase